jgi:hypothetical protein
MIFQKDIIEVDQNVGKRRKSIPHAHKNRPRKGRRKIGSTKRNKRAKAKKK